MIVHARTSISRRLGQPLPAERADFDRLLDRRQVRHSGEFHGPGPGNTGGQRGQLCARGDGVDLARGAQYGGASSAEGIRLVEDRQRLAGERVRLVIDVE
jgi:hypothetical protein